MGAQRSLRYALLNICVVVTMILSHQHITNAFGFTSPKSVTKSSTRNSSSSSSVVLHGWLDFNPFRGSGSGDNQAFKEEQWKIQQEILRARANQGITKDKLKAKYKKESGQDESDKKMATTAVDKNVKNTSMKQPSP